jgi:hypothetical protein
MRSSVRVHRLCAAAPTSTPPDFGDGEKEAEVSDGRPHRGLPRCTAPRAGGGALKRFNPRRVFGIAVCCVGALLFLTPPSYGRPPSCGKSPRGSLVEWRRKPPSVALKNLAVLRTRSRPADQLPAGARRFVPLRVISASFIRRVATVSTGTIYLIPGVLRTRPAILPLRCAKRGHRRKQLRERNERLRRRHNALCLLKFSRQQPSQASCRIVRTASTTFSPLNLAWNVTRTGDLTSILAFDLVPDVVHQVEVDVSSGDRFSLSPSRNLWTFQHEDGPARTDATPGPSRVAWFGADGRLVAAHVFPD